MVRLTQELLRPGAYRLAGGRTGRLTREDLARVAKTTRELLDAGYEIPVLKKHAAKGSAEGGPRKQLPGDPDASSSAPGPSAAETSVERVGHLIQIDQRDDGSLHQVLEIEDDAAARDFESGAVRHTSAELRPNWTDDDGHEFGPIVAHIALTGAPRHTTQPPAELLLETTQFSLETIEGVASEEAVAAIRSQIDRAKIPAGLRSRLWETLAARQFSAERDQPLLALSDVLHLLETSLPPQWRQSESATVASHVAGDAFFTGESLSDDRADQIARRQLQRCGLAQVVSG